MRLANERDFRLRLFGLHIQGSGSSTFFINWWRQVKDSNPHWISPTSVFKTGAIAILPTCRKVNWS